MTSFKTGAATFLWFDKNRTATIRNCLDAGPLAISAVLYDTTGTEIAERQVPLGRDSNCSIFCSLTGCMAIVPLFGGEYYHTIENDCIGADPYDCPKTEDTFHVSLGKFSAEELKSIGHLEIKVGHMKNGQFTEE